jgi:hypothetical protein
MFPIPNGWLEDNAYDPKLNDAMRKVRENFEKFQIGLGATGGKRVASGIGTVTIAAPNVFGVATINHTLGVVPNALVVTGSTAPFGGVYLGTVLTVYNTTATTFDVSGWNVNGYAGGVVVNVQWIAST